MELLNQNGYFAHIWSYGELGLWPLALNFLEMLNTAPVSLSDWQKILTGMYEWRYGSKTVVLNIFGRRDHNLSPLDLKFSEMFNTAPISLFDWRKFLPVTLKWSCVSKTEFLPKFGHVVTLTFDFWNSNFKKWLTQPNKSFSWIKVAAWYAWVELWPQNWIFPHIWSCGDLNLWPMKTNI